METLQEKKIAALMIIIALIPILFACKKVNTERVIPNPTSETLVTASVAGRVTDLNNVPISNASVTAGSSATTTDIDGQFTIKNPQLNKDDGYVKVTRQGYFTGSRTFLVNANSVNNVKIKLIPKIVSGSFTAYSGGTINVSGGGSVTFGPGNIVNATMGAAYTGNVFVSTFFLNPADARFNEYMPGDLCGINTSNQEKILQSFGMVSIEMNDAGGQKLQLATGKTAAITLPIPSAMQANAPATIPLWYFDETKGIWKEEGSAAKQGNNYVGTVAHFSFWNCDLPAESVRLAVSFKDRNGNALADKLVTITSVSYGTKSGYTDSEGTVSGLIPANEPLLMKVSDQCSDIIYTKNLGPFGTDTNLGNIMLAFVMARSVTLSGTVVNCINGTVTSGFVQVNSGNNYFNAAIINGNFNITFYYCSNSSTAATIIAYDVINSGQSTAQIINVTNGNQSIGELTACGNSTPY